MSLAELRKRTSFCHGNLEKRLDLFNRVKTLEDYQEHLGNLYRLLKSFEASLEAETCQNDFFLLESVKENLLRLEADLAALGLTNLSCLSSLKILPPHETRAQRIGSQYVLEGSSLGGQVIARHFREKLGLSKEHGLSYFLGHGEQTGLRWKTFCGKLEGFFSAEPQESEEVYEAAISSFRCFEQALCEKPLHG